MILIDGSAIADSQNENLSGVKIQQNGKTVSLNEVIEQGQKLNDADKIELTRSIINENISYIPPECNARWTGQKRPGVPLQDGLDYGQTLGETLRTGSGDCKAFAVASGELLRRMGVDSSRIEIMGGTVYDADGNKEFDHANLAVKNAQTGKTSVMEITSEGQTVLDASDYLRNGLQGHYFVPTVGTDANLRVQDFSSNEADTPMDRFGRTTHFEEPSKDITPESEVCRPQNLRQHLISQCNLISGSRLRRSILLALFIFHIITVLAG